MFDSKDFPALILALQKAQAEGKGAIATTNLTTVANEFRGIPAGITTEITWVYLSRAPKWEELLSADMQKYVVPPSGGLNVTVKSGHFKHFPHYTTEAASIDYRRANLLSNLQGWVVKENKDLFEAILK